MYVAMFKLLRHDDVTHHDAVTIARAFKSHHLLYYTRQLKHDLTDGRTVFTTSINQRVQMTIISESVTKCAEK